MYRRTLYSSIKRYQSVGDVKVDSGVKDSLNIINYLCKYGVDKLQTEYPIYVCPHSKFPHLLHFSFKVNEMSTFLIQEFHTDVQMNEILDESTGGLVVDTKNNFQIISYAFPKIYNHFEKRAPSIDWLSGLNEEI